jgi:hypothetical protein
LDSKIRLKGKTFKENISDLIGRRRKINGRKKSLLAASSYYASILWPFKLPTE